MQTKTTKTIVLQLGRLAWLWLLLVTLSYRTAAANIDSCQGFNELNTQIRDGRINKAVAATRVGYWLSHFSAMAPQFSKTNRYIFPVKGYTSAAIGGKNGSGYIASGYSFFDGNAHGGHPAHDIFIHDAPQSSLDDRTNKPVPVVSVSDGIVVALEDAWLPATPQRGGNYIWIYNPADSLLYYYAHNSQVLVRLCDRVKAGQPIATVGRTGANAAKKRSPTHLHFMVLQWDGATQLKPINPYQLLVQGKVQQ